LNAKHTLSFVFVLVLSLAAASCSDDNNANTLACGPGLIVNPVTNQCILDTSDLDNVGDASDTIDPNDVTDPPDNVIDDLGDDTDPDMPDDADSADSQETFDPTCDQDRDGALNMNCGGDDCDDNNPRRRPGLMETCDQLDNNCNDRVNEFIDCSFFAHTDDGLFRIDPFLGELEEINTMIPRFFDIDTHPDGDLFGLTETALAVYVPATEQWFDVLTLDTPNLAVGLAFDPAGVGVVTAGNTLYRLDLETMQLSVDGSLGNSPNDGPYQASGDCVIDKNGSLFVSSRHKNGVDTLIFVNRENGQTEERGDMMTEDGSVRYDGVFGLTFAFGNLYGVTDDGELIEINPQNGVSRTVANFQGRRFFGAASTPSR